MGLELFGLCLYAYLAGAVPTPYLIARLVKGIDLRNYGSGNVGGSNVIRQLGKRWFVPLTAIEFLLKGLSPTLLAYLILADDFPSGPRASFLFLCVPLLALIGNNWSVFLRFQGGRGLMVVCGITLALVPVLFLVTITVYLIGWRVSRNSAVWALVAIVLLPILAWVPGGAMTLDWQGLWLLGRDGISSLPGRNESLVISVLGCAILGVVVLKRLVGNSLSFPEDVSTNRVILNRLFKDRDVDDREKWVGRTPD
ncbi:MAG: glycerol-3-phosphate acyltransferase [Chloroflexota bacterium]|nr:glycerol-3-phosphate acyltransferase [Chloroflexota bacterium]